MSFDVWDLLRHHLFPSFQRSPSMQRNSPAEQAAENLRPTQPESPADTAGGFSSRSRRAFLGGGALVTAGAIVGLTGGEAQAEGGHHISTATQFRAIQEHENAHVKFV